MNHTNSGSGGVGEPSESELGRVYAEATSIARYFWDWRYKLLTYSLTLNVALFTAAGWTYIHTTGDNQWISVLPLAGGALTCVLLMVMDHRNSRLLDWSYAVSAPIEKAWLARAPHVGGGEVRGFYGRMIRDLRTERTFMRAWARRNSSYTYILRWWFTFAFAAYVACLVLDVLRLLGKV